MCISSIITAISTLFTAGFMVFQYIETKKKEKKAVFRFKIEDASNGCSKGFYSDRIRFINVGKSNAKNVRIEILPPENEIEKEKFLEFVNKYKFGPYELINSNSEKVEVICSLHISKDPKTLKIKITWDDDYSKNRSDVFLEDLY